MDVSFLQRRWRRVTPKDKSSSIRPILIFHRWKGKTYAESQVGGATKPGAR